MDLFGGFTRWVNPTKDTLKLDFCVQAGADKNDQRLKVVIPPVGTVISRRDNDKNLHQLDSEGRLICTQLPSMFDGGIHIVRDGVVVGGMAPQLRKLDEPNPDIAPELDPLDTRKTAELEKATMAMAQKVAAEKQLILSGAAVAAVNDQQAEIRATAAAAEQARIDAATQLEEANKARAEVEQMKREALAMKADAEKAKAEAAKVTREAEKSKAEADKAMAAATEPSTGGGGAAGSDGNGGKGTGKSGGKAGG